MPCVELAVGGLNPDYPRHLVLMAFGEYGKVVEISMAGDLVMVHMNDSEAALNAMVGLNGATLKGDVTITVTKSDDQSYQNRRRLKWVCAKSRC